MDSQNIKINAGLFIDTYIQTEQEIKQYIENIHSFVGYVDNLYIYNSKKQDLTPFYQALNKYSHIEYADVIGYSEVEIYELFFQKSTLDAAKFAVMLKPGYQYEEESFLNIKKYVLNEDTSHLALITPMPLLGCEIFEKKAETHRLIKGCKFIGAFINLDIYQKMSGLKKEYYQTTFDYEYCLRVRSQGFDVMLAQNEVLRNQNYKVITKKHLFGTLSTYDKDLIELYYETRNRFFLWKEYKDIDREYIRIDKKLFRQEKHEMRFRDPHHNEKFKMIEKAMDDFKENKLGKYIEEE